MRTEAKASPYVNRNPCLIAEEEMAGRQMGSASVRRRSGRGGLRGCDCGVADL
jgi:hypothetical protein